MSTIGQGKAEEEFRAKLHARGILPPSPLPVGKFTRCRVEGRPRGKDGAFLYFDDAVPAGGYQNHTDGKGWENWHASGIQNLSDADRSAHKARIQAAREEHEARDKQKAADAARKAQALLDAAQTARNDHPYAVRKLLTVPSTLREIGQADALRILGYTPRCGDEPLEGRLLVVPIYIDGKLSTVELIDEHGGKHAIHGGKKKTGFWTTQALPDGDGSGSTVLIAEGMATTVSATMATGYLGVAALSCGNLLDVGKAIRHRYPRAKLVFVADLGIGVEKSTEAARAVDGYVAVPDFGDGQ